MKTIRALLILLVAVPLAAQRLPKTVIPIHYEISFAPDFSTDTFRGTEMIEVSIQQPTPDITLHAVQITFDEVSVEAEGKRQSASVKLNPQTETATLSVPEQIPIGTARIYIRYSGILNSELRGLYLGRANGRKYAATQMEAADARRAFPSFDEPELKATFTISAVVNDADQAISNGATVSDTPGPEPGKHTVRFATTPRMSTYLVALVIGEFDCLRGEADGIPMGVCATPDKVQLGKLALADSEAFMRFFNDYFGVAYPFGKLDHIGVPDFAAGAMENTGAILYRDFTLLKDEKASIQSRKGLAGIIAHEMAHLWFGDLVTMRWWDDIWLNEGFATFMSSKPIAALHPQWNVPVDTVRGISGPMNFDSLLNTRPIRVEVRTTADANEVFDSISYGKAAAVLGMIESFIGEEAFRKGVSAYLKDFSFRNATSDDFAEALQQAAPDTPVDRILDTFVKQPGVPLVNVETSCVNDRTLVKLSQKRFFVDPRLSNRESKEMWSIPICARLVGSKETDCRVISERKETLRLSGCAAPVILNSGGRGYFLTALNDRELRRLTSRFGELSDPERIVLLRDEWLLVRATRRTIPEFLTLADSILDTERSRSVLDQVLGSLSTIVDWLPSADRENYRQWLRGQLRPLAAELGWEVTAEEGPDRQELRADVIATLGVAARDPRVLAEARRRAATYFKDPSSIDPSLAPTVLFVAGTGGDEQLFDQVIAELDRAKTPEERQRLVSMLGAFRDPRLMRRLLEWALLPETRLTEARSFLGSVLGSVEGRQLGWEFLNSRWTDISKKFSPPMLAGLVRATGSFCDPAMKEAVKRFVETHPVELSERALARTLESIDLCVQTSRFQAPKLAAWLKQPAAPASN